MKFDKLFFNLFLFFIGHFFTTVTFAQQNYCNVIFANEQKENKVLNGLKINIFQNNLLQTVEANLPIKILKGVEFRVEFESSNFIIPGISKLKIYRDTVITILSNSMSPVIINSKKRLVRQTHNGYDYYPANDSIYKNQSILLALQRLPFVKLIDEKIEYKDQKKILFQINGKERKGIGNNWEDILKVIKAKDIYKVELIEEIPILVRNQGYDAIINIQTVDANIYGKSINAVMILDQRENLNPTVAITQLRKRADYSFKINNINDNQIIKRESKVFESSRLILKNGLSSKYLYHFIGSNFDYGLRIDSFRNFSINASYKISSNNTRYINEYNFPALLNNQKNKIVSKTGDINLSYVLSKTPSVTRSFIANFNVVEKEFNNRISYLQNLPTDSINNVSSTTPAYFIFEYNVLNSKNLKHRFEFGIQSYGKRIEQNFSKYSLDVITNKNKNLLYQKMDSFSLLQYSVRPYFRLAKVLTDRKSIVLISNAEFYAIKNKYQPAKYFFLPTMSFKFKELLDKNTSVTYNLKLGFLKPSTELLTPIQFEVNPNINTVGSSDLIPGKSLAFTVDYTIVKKATISHSAGINYNFDAINYFTLYDSVNKNLLIFPDNNGKEFSLNYSLYFQKQVSKRLQFSATGSSSYLIVKNIAFSSAYKGFRFGLSNNISFKLSPKLGSIGFVSIINGNNINSQGTQSGILKYSFYYSKAFFKGKLITTFTASEFVLKRRTINSNSKYKNFEYFTTIIQPSRLLLIRVAYNFSNIRTSKLAKRKTTNIENEIIL